MSYETYTKRIIYVAQCDCGERDVKLTDSAKSRLCKCGKWVEYKMESYIGKDRFDK